MTKILSYNGLKHESSLHVFCETATTHKNKTSEAIKNGSWLIFDGNVLTTVTI